MFKDAQAEVPYEKSVLVYKEKDKYGIIDYQGKKITSAEYDSIESLLYKEGCLVVKQNNKYGIININGAKITEIEYDSITADGYYDEETKYKNAGFIVGKKIEDEYRYGYINNEGNIILDVEFSEIQRVTDIMNSQGIYLISLKNGQAGVYRNKEELIKQLYDKIEYNKQNELFIVENQNKKGILNRLGNEILKLEYDSITILKENIMAQKDQINYYFDKNGKEIKQKNNKSYIATQNDEYFITVNQTGQYGIENKVGNIVAEDKYSYVEYVYKNYFIVIENGKASIYDAYNRQIIVSNYNSIQRIEEKNAIQAIVGNNEAIDIYNENMQKVYSMQKAAITNNKKYIKLSSKTDRKYFDENGNIVENTKIFQNSELYAFENDGKWGFKDKQGNVIVNAIYDMVTEINEYGFAAIRMDDKWGVINSKGNIIIQPIYKLNVNEPDFIGPYFRQNLGYGIIYYTKDIENAE